MLHLRLVTPPRLTQQVLELLEGASDVTNVWRLPGAARKPPGDLVSCDVAREDASSLIAELRTLGLDRAGSIAVENVDVSISDASDQAEFAAPGSPADAIVWEEVESRVEEGASLSQTFILLMLLATMIGAVGILTDSIVLIIGAMVVGPEYGPLAGVCVALVEGRPRLAGRSLHALAVGFPLSIMCAALLTAVLVLVGAAPSTPTPDREITLFSQRGLKR